MILKVFLVSSKNICGASLAFLLFQSCLFAASLDGKVESIVSSGSARRALWGVYAQDVQSGSTLADINGGKLFVPASNRKLVTTAMTATTFESDHRFRSELRTSEITSGGLVPGDLTFHPVGDPSWMPGLLSGRSGQWVLDDLVSVAKESGLQMVQGDLVIDMGRFEEPAPYPPGWSWDNFAASYASRGAVFSLNSNLVGISVTPTSTGQPIAYEISSPVIPFTVQNLATTGRSGSVPTFRIDRFLEGKTLMLLGSLPANGASGTRSIPLGDPVAYNAALLKETFQSSGIMIKGDIRFEMDVEEGPVLLGAIEGKPVSEIVNYCNKESNNFLAESLYLLCAGEYFGRVNYRGAHQVEEKFWKKVGVDPDDILKADGSGLSRDNAITPRALVGLLEYMHDTDWFVESLPLSGHSGTLRYRLSGNGMGGRVQAKTGTLDNVSALSGYVTTNSGKTVAFSIMANNYTSSTASIRKKIDEIVILLAAR